MRRTTELLAALFRRATLITVTAGAAGACVASPAARGMEVALQADARCEIVEHVVLISIDGFRPEFYLDEEWPAPTLRNLARQGIHARRVTPAFPSVTYPSHTTIVTGVPPAEHGIPFNAKLDDPNEWYFWADAITAPTLWDAVRNEGGVVASLWWPVTVGAGIDYNLPVPPNPSSASRTRVDELRKVMSPAGLLEELERNVTGPLNEENFANGSLAKEVRIGRMAEYLIRTYHPALTLVHIVATDGAQHRWGRDGQAVRRAVANADSVVAGIVEALHDGDLAERTAVLITGDHGFVEYDTRIAPNLWLVDAGLLDEDEDLLDARAVFRTAGGSAFLHVAQEEDTDEVMQSVLRVIEALPARIRARFDVIDAELLDALGAHPSAILALSARPGTSFSPQREAPLLNPLGETRGVHGHAPVLDEIHTGFIGTGAGLPRDKAVEGMKLVDIAPLVTSLLGIDAFPGAATAAGLLPICSP